MTDPTTPPPAEPTPDPAEESPRQHEESGAPANSAPVPTTQAPAEMAAPPAVGTAEATDAAIAALAAARAAALAPVPPPVADVPSVDPTLTDPAPTVAAATDVSASDAAATLPATTEVGASDAAATVPSGTAADASMAAAVAVPTEAGATVPASPDAAAAAPAAAAPAAAAGPGRRATARRLVRNLGIVVLTVGLFVGGIALGATLFQNMRPAAAGGPAVAISDGDPPPVAQEFISALAANDADALRSSLDQTPHLDLTQEMTKFGIQRVDNVRILGTHSEGSRSATEILMQYESTDGTPFAINLVILVDGGKIEGFR